MFMWYDECQIHETSSSEGFLWHRKKTSDFFVNIKGKNDSNTNGNMSNVSVSHLFYLLLAFCISAFLSLCSNTYGF